MSKIFWCKHLYDVSSSHNVEDADRVPKIFVQHFGHAETLDDVENWRRTVAESERLSNEKVQPIETVEKWLPQPNIVYQYIEDADSLQRVNSMYTRSKSSEKDVFTMPKTIHRENLYATHDIQIEYLKSKPVCFLMCGKPEIGEIELGKAIAEFWDCVYLDPEVVLLDEIQSQSFVGRWIEANLRQGCTIGSEIILNLIEERINSAACRHRGFLLAGVPLIPNDMYDKEENLFMGSLIKLIPSGHRLDEEVDNDPTKSKHHTSLTDLKMMSPEVSHDECVKTQTFNIYKNLIEDMKRILKWFEQPFAIIYLSCPLPEVLVKREQNRFNIYTGQGINLGVLKLSSNNDGPMNMDQMKKAFSNFIDHNHIKHLVKLVRHECGNVRDEVDHFNKFLRPILDDFFLSMNQECIIKVDARISTSVLFQTVRARLRTMPLQPVVLAEKFTDILQRMPKKVSAEEENEEEEEAPIFDFEGKSAMDVYSEIRILATIGPKFRWQLSDWGLMCPVALYEGRIVEGDPTLPVRYMNRIFFLENDFALNKFCANPRPYLLPPNPKPPMKVFVFGMSHSGATDVARCFGYIFDAQVVDVDQLIDDYKNAQIQSQIKVKHDEILQEAIKRRYNMLSVDYEASKKARTEKAMEWVMRVIHLYIEYNTIMSDLPENFYSDQQSELEIDESTTADVTMASVDETASIVESEETHDEVVSIAYETLSHESELPSTEKIRGNIALLIEKIQGANVPIELEFIRQAILNPSLLDKYKPLIYRDLEPLAMPDDSDRWVDGYVKDQMKEVKVETRVKITRDIISALVVNKIKEIEYSKAMSTNNVVKNGGWIVVNLKTPEIMDNLMEVNIIPDEIVHLFDLDPDSSHMLSIYKRGRLSDYLYMKDFLLRNGFVEAAERCSVNPDHLALITRYIVEDILNDMLRASQFDYVDYVEEYFGEDGGMDDYNMEDTQVTEPIFDDEPVGEGGSLPERTDYKYLFHKDHTEFENVWTFVENFVSDKPTILVHEVNLVQPIEDLMLDAVKNLISRYRFKAIEFDEEERALELLERAPAGGLGEEEQEAEGEGEPEDFTQKRNYGDTRMYCPVALTKHNVFWKGKDEFTALYDQKLYLMANDETYNAFLQRPRDYIPLTNSFLPLPPLRLCVVGPIGSGKSTIARELAQDLGITYVDHITNINLYLVGKGIHVGRKTKSLLIEVNDSDFWRTLSPTKLRIVEQVQAYLEAGEPLPEDLLKTIVLPLWRNEPWCKTGVVIDGFPHCDSDIDFMTNNYCIPDMIIQLQASLPDVLKRTYEDVIETWKEEMLVARVQREKENTAKLIAWELKRETRFRNVYQHLIYLHAIDAIVKGEISVTNLAGKDLEQALNLQSLGEGFHFEEAPQIHPKLLAKAKELINTAGDKEEAVRRVEKELPELVFNDVWETLPSAGERLAKMIEDYYELETNFQINFQDLAALSLIPFSAIKTGRSIEKVVIEIEYILDSIKFANESYLESTAQITLEEAFQLLKCGYYFLSKYGYTCPIQVFEQTCPIQMFLPGESLGNLFPIIHRQYIYFVHKKENITKFCNNPMKYILSTDESFPIRQVRLAIVGAPKSGKTTLAQRFARDLGMKVVSRGGAIRYVLQELNHTLLACLIDAQLRNGQLLDHYLVIKAVEVCCLEGAAVYQGIVFDGFPTHIEEINELLKIGLIPHQVIHLDAFHEFCSKCLENDVWTGRKDVPKYSQMFMKHRHCCWIMIQMHLLNWISNNLQNLYSIHCKYTKWHVWHYASAAVMSSFSQVVKYNQYFDPNQAWCLKKFCVTGREFTDRQSQYLNYCPGCLVRDHVLNYSSIPPEGKNLIQYKEHFYFVCEKHLKVCYQQPKMTLVLSADSVQLPKTRPIRAIGKIGPFAQDGFCIVCFWNTQHKNQTHNLTKGNPKYVLQYGDKNYVFCSEDCLQKFSAKPAVYSKLNISYRQKREVPKIDAKSLPTKGYLEQTQSKLLIRACTNAGYWRPKYPKLSPELSAVIKVGLLLKVNNPKTSKNELELYTAYLDKYMQQCADLERAIKFFKDVMNPYVPTEAIDAADDPFFELSLEPEKMTFSNEKFTKEEIEYLLRPEDAGYTKSAQYHASDTISISIMSSVIRYLNDVETKSSNNLILEHLIQDNYF